MTYADHPAVLQLRAMNIIYETTKERAGAVEAGEVPPVQSEQFCSDAEPTCE